MTSRDRIRIRAARLDDHVEVASLRRALSSLHARLQPDFFRPPDGTDSEEERALGALSESLASPSEVVLVAIAPAAGTRSPRVAGFVHANLRDTPDTPEMARRRRVHVDEIAVARGFRRGGIGRLLVEAAGDWGRARGAVQVVLTVWSGNRGAERFYRALGYATVGRIVARELP